MKLTNFALLLPAAEALTFFSGRTSPMRTTPLPSPQTFSQPVGKQYVSSYSTALHLVPKQCTPRSTNRIHASDDNVEVESEIQSSTNSTLHAIGNNETTTIHSEDVIYPLGIKSGWATFGLSLLPSWSSTAELQSDASSMSGDTNISFSIFSEGSNSVLDNVDGDAVNDLILGNEFEYDKFTVNDENVPENSDGIIQKLIRHTVAAIRRVLVRISLSPSESSTRSFDEMDSLDETMLENITTVKNDSSSDLPVDAQNKTEDKVVVANSLDHKQRAGSRRRHFANQIIPPIFTSLESIDINATTLATHRRWERRRRRAFVAYKVAKNAVFLFVVTFCAGNLINQFVDLDENGSFEVHFGKVLSSTPTTTSTPKSDKDGKRASIRESLFRSISTPKQNLDGDRARALGLVSRAVRRIGPAVVRIETETYSDGGGDNLRGIVAAEQSGIKMEQVQDDGEDTGDIFDGFPETARSIDFGQGSGIIINSEGYILTNAHVVEGATHVNVCLTDGRRFRAEPQGSDDVIDIAVLKIIPDLGSEVIDNLPVADIGNSDEIEVGTFVTAIGSPGGLDCSCTIGIVSGLKRCPKVVGIPDKFGVVDYIQTDAAINEGNSGGPLVDVESGTIVGVNTCIRANMEGTSFAIPINKVMGIVDDLSEGNRITHGYLGVHMSTMNPALARYYNKVQCQKNKVMIPEREGVMIEKVFKNSPAQIGGLKKFDFISEIGGQRVEKADDAHVLIDRAAIGQVMNIKVIRGDSVVSVQVKPEDLSPRLKQLREERSQRKFSNIKE